MAGGQDRRGVEAVVSAVEIGRVHLQRTPQLGRLRRVRVEVGRQPEPGGHHADDLDGDVVEQQLAPDDGRIAAVTRLPQRIAEDGHRRPVGRVLGLGERAAHQRRRAEHVEQVGGGEADPHPHRFAISGQVLLARRPAGDGRHARREFPVIPDFLRREPGLVEADPLAPDEHALLRRRVRERGEEDGLHHAENGGRGPDAEGQGDQRGGRESRALPQVAGRTAKVLSHRISHGHDVLPSGG